MAVTTSPAEAQTAPPSGGVFFDQGSPRELLRDTHLFGSLNGEYFGGPVVRLGQFAEYEDRFQPVESVPTGEAAPHQVTSISLGWPPEAGTATWETYRVSKGAVNKSATQLYLDFRRGIVGGREAFYDSQGGIRGQRELDDDAIESAAVVVLDRVFRSGMARMSVDVFCRERARLEIQIADLMLFGRYRLPETDDGVDRYTKTMYGSTRNKAQKGLEERVRKNSFVPTTLRTIYA